MTFRPLRPFVWVPLAAVTLSGAFAGGMWYERRETRAREEWAEARLLSTAIDSVRANALDSLPSDELMRRAVSGMLRELQDPYAAMLRPDGYEQYRGSLQGAGRGFGIMLRRDANGASVSRVAPGSPAMAAGIRAGDRILEVDGVPARDGWGRRTDSTTAQPAQHLVTLWRAPYGDTLRVVLRRATWHMPAVTDQGLLSDSVAYVRVATMSSRSAEELEQAVESLVQRGATSLVLDLRGNAGGLFEEGVKAAGLFLERGALVSSLAGRSGAPPQPYRSRNSRWPTMPVTVLVDGGTASAAEIVAAALRDYDRAQIVGVPTYGKGVVQRVLKVSSDISLRLTTARWLTPRGYALERRTGKGDEAKGGLVPDVLVDDAARRDPSALPEGWARAAGQQVAKAADSLAMFALREGWAINPLPELEGRLRGMLAQMAPFPPREAAARAEWVTVATRLATVRMLEVERASEALLRYGLREDAVLRAGLDAVAPGTSVAQVHPAALPAPLGRRALMVP
jgi:carboxyl-terminal processing protease